MKKISFGTVALLVVVIAVASAFKTSGTKSLPITGWYEVYDNIVAPTAPLYYADPLDNPFYDPIAFQPGAIDYEQLDCGSVSDLVCAAYFRASNEMNIQSPPIDGMVYFLSGGRP